MLRLQTINDDYLLTKVINSTKENREEVLTLVSKRLASANEDKVKVQTPLLKIAHAYLNEETGKDLLRRPKKLNQYADQDKFFALMLLGRSCSKGHRRQAIIHYTLGLMLLIANENNKIANENKKNVCAGLSDDQIQLLKNEANEYLKEWAKKGNSEDKTEREYALLAQWAIEIIPSIKKILVVNPLAKIHTLLKLASSNRFPMKFDSQERATIRDHLEKGLLNGFGHGFPPDMSLSAEKNMLEIVLKSGSVPVPENKVYHPSNVSQPSVPENESRFFKRTQRLEELRQEQSSTPKVEPVTKPGQPGKP